MTPKPFPIFVVAAWLAAAPLAFGAAGDDATITVVDEGATPDDVVKVIELPAARGPAPVSPTKGPSTDPKNNGNEKKTDPDSASGQQVSEDARNKDLRDQIKAEAKKKDKNDARDDNPGKGHGPH